MKLTLGFKPINKQLFKNKYQMPNIDELLDVVNQFVTEQKAGTLYFSLLDSKIYRQTKLAADKESKAALR